MRIAPFATLAVVIASSVVAVPTTLGVDLAVRTVALAGMQAPDQPAGEVFSSFGGPRIDADGRVAFEARTAGGPSGTIGGWFEGEDGLKRAFHDQQSLPSVGTGYRLWLPYGVPPVTGVGSEAFFGIVQAPSGGTGGGYSMLASRSGVVEPLATEGQQIPATSWVVTELNGSSVPVMSPSGRAAFFASVGQGGGSGRGGILTHQNGILAYAAPYGSPASGMEGWTFTSAFSEPVINDNGVTAFAASVQKPGHSAFGIWAEDGGTPRLVVSTNTPVPGQPGLSFGMPATPSINNVGDVAFKAYSPTPTIWSERSGTLSRVLGVGDHAPGTDDGVTFESVDWPLISGSGAVSFSGTLTGPGVTGTNAAGIWCSSEGESRLVVRAGDAVPGMPAGIVFKSLPDSWMMNALGQIAFLSTLQGPGVPAHSSGIWLTGLDGSLNRLIGTGDTLAVAPGDIRTLSGVWMGGISGGQDGRASCFNASGQLAFIAGFTDGSGGIFVATIPEPAGSILLSIAWLMVLRRRC